jgi:REP element-mobilizing transposase RayT
MSQWDYSENGMYFITIVCNNRINWFGKIENCKMILSNFGKIVNDEWMKSFEIRNELFLDEYIIMPDHLHAIVLLKKMVDNNGSDDTVVDNGIVETHGHFPIEPHGRFLVETHGRASLSSVEPTNNSIFQRKPKSISSFMAGFKSATSNEIDNFIDNNGLEISKFNKNNRLWQPNYYDRIIRNESEYYKRKNYIINNPLKWNDDKSNR